MPPGKAHLYLVSFMRLGLVVQDPIIGQVQKDRLVISEGHLFRGFSAIAAPVFDHTGALAGSVTLLGIGSRIDRSPKSEMVAQVRQTALDLSRELGRTDR